MWLYQGYFKKKTVLVLHIKICFVKIGVVLIDILVSQKCLKWQWFIIGWWILVAWFAKETECCPLIFEYSMQTTWWKSDEFQCVLEPVLYCHPIFQIKKYICTFYIDMHSLKYFQSIYHSCCKVRTWFVNCKTKWLPWMLTNPINRGVVAQWLLHALKAGFVHQAERWRVQFPPAAVTIRLHPWLCHGTATELPIWGERSIKRRLRGQGQ